MDSWENSFKKLDKSIASAEVIGGYDIQRHLEKYSTRKAAILDFGCGTGTGVKRLTKAGYSNVVGADPSAELLSKAPTDLSPRLFQINNNALPFNASSFDLVYTVGVLHHISWDNLRNTLLEISRVVRSGGIFVYAEPRASLLRSIGHMVVLSPIRLLSRQVGYLANCLEGEWDTYEPWLHKSHHEFLPMCEGLGWKKLSMDLRSVTQIGVLEKL